MPLDFSIPDAPFPVPLSTLTGSRFEAKPAPLLLPIDTFFPFGGGLRNLFLKWLPFPNYCEERLFTARVVFFLDMSWPELQLYSGTRVLGHIRMCGMRGPDQTYAFPQLTGHSISTPDSTTCPLSRTTIWSHCAAVERRWATKIDVRPCVQKYTFTYVWICNDVRPCVQKYTFTYVWICNDVRPCVQKYTFTYVWICKWVQRKCP